VDEEVRALEDRYQTARTAALRRGRLAFFEKFQDSLQESSAVINANARALYSFVTDEKSLYANYEHGVDGCLRKPATFRQDAERRGIGSTLFGTYASEIIYAALSLTGFGLHSYGAYAMKLKEVAIKERATLLETNSFKFVREHRLTPGGSSPPGYRAPWKERGRLAVVKLTPYITSSIADDDISQLLLSSSGDRASDEYIEVHIYGTFDLNAIESVTGNSNAGSRNDRDLLRMTKQHLKKVGIPWIEND